MPKSKKFSANEILVVFSSDKELKALHDKRLPRKIIFKTRQFPLEIDIGTFAIIVGLARRLNRSKTRIFNEVIKEGIPAFCRSRKIKLPHLVPDPLFFPDSLNDDSEVIFKD